MIMERKDCQWKVKVELLREILSPEPIFPPLIPHGAVSGPPRAILCSQAPQ